MQGKTQAKTKEKTHFWRILAFGAAIVFFAGLGVRYLSFNSRIARFRSECRSIHKGDAVEDLRQRASQYGLHLEVDSDPTAFADDGYYLLKPWADWPRQFSCRYHVKLGKVIADN